MTINRSEFRVKSVFRKKMLHACLHCSVKRGGKNITETVSGYGISVCAGSALTDQLIYNRYHSPFRCWVRGPTSVCGYRHFARKSRIAPGPPGPDRAFLHAVYMISDFIRFSLDKLKAYCAEAEYGTPSTTVAVWVIPEQGD